MIDQQPIQMIHANKSSYLSPKGFFSLDTYPDGNTDTISIATDQNTLIDRQISCYSQAFQRAEALYRSVRFASQVSRFLSWLFHQPVHLMDASEIIPDEITAHHFSGLRSVAISHIIASVIYIDDFDSAFCPLNDQNRTRWINVAATTLLGAELPAVDVLQIDSAYIACDGHNRISVARALGQENIDAYVTKLQYPSKGTFGNRSK